MATLAEIETLRKILKESLDAVKELPEVQRSKAVAGGREYRREIDARKKAEPSDKKE